MPAVPTEFLIDRHGRRIVSRSHVVPDGATLHVPTFWMDQKHADRVADVRSARVFGDGLRHRPGYVQSVLGDGFEATTSNQHAQSASEVARQDYINRISNQWRQTWQRMPPSAHKPKSGLASYDPGDTAGDDTDDNATMGITKTDAPDDVQQMTLTQQNAYVSAFNQHAEENPEDGFDECAQAGREAIEALQEDSVEDAAARLERVRDEIQVAQRRRLENAWRTR